MYAGRTQDHPGHAAEVLQMAGAEQESGLTGLSRWRQFARDAEAQRTALLAELRRLTRAGKTIAGYGAPAKGNTLLNYCGIGTDLLHYTFDRNPLKVHTLTPGTHIPVLPVETILERQPDYLLLLAWNFADEIMSQQAEYRRRGGQFILPIPIPRIVG